MLQLFIKYNYHLFTSQLIDYGIQLTESELKLRYVIKSILHANGLDLQQYSRFFKSEALDEQPKLIALLESGLGFVENGAIVKLTSHGIDFSDAIGPWLYSEIIQSKIKQFELK